jgi:hypothetical protein
MFVFLIEKFAGCLDMVHCFLWTPIKKQSCILLKEELKVGNAVARTLSRWLPITAARVLSQVRPCGICERSGTGANLLRVLHFPLSIIIPPTEPHSYIIDALQSRYRQRRKITNLKLQQCFQSVPLLASLPERTHYKWASFSLHM